MEKRYLAMWMWLCEGELKVKTADFRLPPASQKRACLTYWYSTAREQKEWVQLAQGMMGIRVSIKCQFIMWHKCPGLNANEIQIPYDKHHKVSSLVKSHQNTNNSVKYEVIWKCQITLPDMKY